MEQSSFRCGWKSLRYNLRRGTDNQGVIYKLAPVQGGRWKYTVFHSFNLADGANPTDNPVTFDASGNLFVATEGGGLRPSYGVVLEISP